MTTPNVKMRGDSRISKSGAWTPQQLIDLRSIWDDVIRSVNGGVLSKDLALPDDTEITVDFDQVGSTNAGTGVMVTLYVNPR